MEITPKREQRFKSVISKRQNDLTVILENVHDPHNIGAVMRSCDAVGISEIYVLNSEKKPKDKLFGLNSSSGSGKWVKVIYFEDVKECMEVVKSKYQKIYGTHLSHDAKSIHDLSLHESCALLFGNEHDGITDEALQHVDQNLVIPQFGMVQSLNISVACAISVYEALRQRITQGKYSSDFDENNSAHVNMYQHFLERHKLRN